jgi:type I restriction enzyme, S subunit
MIDGFIRAKRKLIGLLNEQKQAIIHSAVTRGLNPDAPLKPSGIPWFGEIPAHWQTPRLSQISTSIGDGLHGTPEYVEQSPYYFINGNNLANGSIRLKSSTRCVSIAELKRHRVELNENTILMSINGTIGSLAYYRGESIILGKSVAYINCGKSLAREYLFYILQSPAVLNFLQQEVTGTTIFNLSLASIRRLPIAIPLIDDQLKIAEEIEKTIGPVSTAISRTEREIFLMLEYRTRLTADIVTGKLDVREAVARLPDLPVDADHSPDADTGAEDFLDEPESESE